MNCFNGQEYLREAIDSVYCQTYPDWEIIFFDNASTDRSAEIANSYDERLRYFRSERAIPLGSARNHALQKASGEYIAFLDTDDVWLPAKLEKQVALMESNPTVGLVHSDVVNLNQREGERISHFALLGHKPPRGRVFGYLLKFNALSMPSVMLRTMALRAQPEWFDERFEIYPDFDLFRRIAHDWGCDYVDEPLAIYRLHTASSSARKHTYAAQEIAQTIEKFLRLYPDIERDHGAEINFLKAMIAYQRGKSYWRAGQAQDARKEFSRYLNIPKVATAYAASFMPYPLVERLWWAVRHVLNRHVRY